MVLTYEEKIRLLQILQIIKAKQIKTSGQRRAC